MKNILRVCTALLASCVILNAQLSTNAPPYSGGANSPSTNAPPTLGTNTPASSPSIPSATAWQYTVVYYGTNNPNGTLSNLVAGSIFNQMSPGSSNLVSQWIKSNPYSSATWLLVTNAGLTFTPLTPAQTTGAVQTVLVSGPTIGNSTGVFTLTQPTATNYWTNSPTMLQAAGPSGITEGFFRNVQPTPIVRYYLYSYAGNPGCNESNAMWIITNYANCSNVMSLGPGTFVWDLNSGWQATNGTIYDSNGICQYNPNAFPDGMTNITAQIHARGWLAGIQIQGANIDGSDDGGLPWRGCTNIYGNVMNALTNWGFDVVFGHGRWSQSPQVVMDDDIQAELACVNSGRRAWYSPQALETTAGASPTWNLWMPVFQRFFPVIAHLSSSGFGDQMTNLAEYKALFDYTMTNSFQKFVGPGHTLEDMSIIGGSITKYDPVWRANKVIASATASLSAGYTVGNSFPNLDAYGSCYFPIDVIKYVQQDPLVSWPSLVLTTNSGKVYVLLKKLQNNSYSVDTINWDTNNATNVIWNTTELGLPQNCTAYRVKDLWTNVADWYLPVGATYTNVLNSGDCTHYVLTPIVRFPRIETNYVDFGPWNVFNVTATQLNAGTGDTPYGGIGFSYTGTSTAYITFGIPAWATNANVTIGCYLAGAANDSLSFSGLTSYWIGPHGERGIANLSTPPPVLLTTAYTNLVFNLSYYPGTNCQQWVQIAITGTNTTAKRYITGPAGGIFTGQ